MELEFSKFARTEVRPVGSQTGSPTEAAFARMQASPTATPRQPIFSFHALTLSANGGTPSRACILRAGRWPALSRKERNAWLRCSFPSIGISFEARVFVAKH
jgi:hypothetical protein